MNVTRDRNIEVNGTVFNYRETGDTLGPTLVALHVLGEGVGEDEVVEMKPRKGCCKNAMGFLYASDAASPRRRRFAPPPAPGTQASS